MVCLLKVHVYEPVWWSQVVEPLKGSLSQAVLIHAYNHSFLKTPKIKANLRYGTEWVQGQPGHLVRPCKELRRGAEGGGCSTIEYLLSMPKSLGLILACTQLQVWSALRTVPLARWEGVKSLEALPLGRTNAGLREWVTFFQKQVALTDHMEPLPVLECVPFTVLSRMLWATIVWEATTPSRAKQKSMPYSTFKNKLN